MRDSDRAAGLRRVIAASQLLALFIVIAGVVTLSTDFSWTVLIGLVVADGLILLGARGLRRTVRRLENPGTGA